MKKLFLAAVLSVSIVASSFATDINYINSKVTNDFAFQFVKAENVQWSTSESYMKASFTLDNKKMEAYYDLDGNLVGSSRSIQIDELPVIAKRSFAKRYGGYTVKEAIKFDATDETAYFLSAENESHSVILKVSAQGMMSLYKNVKK